MIAFVDFKEVNLEAKKEEAKKNTIENQILVK